LNAESISSVVDVMLIHYLLIESGSLLIIFCPAEIMIQEKQTLEWGVIYCKVCMI
jgi:hypothetical protein